MRIKQDPVTKLWAREDGAVLMPPAGHFKTFRWTFGSDHGDGYRAVCHHRKHYFVHQIVCRAFHGLCPPGKPEVDHINRIPWDNRSANLRYADRSLNNTNKDYVDRSIEKYGVRQCEDLKAYHKVYDAAYAAKMRAQGLSFRKGPDGRSGWYPRIRA